MGVLEYVFERAEKKYLITGAQRRDLLEAAGERLTRDRFGHSSILNLYFDTPDYRLVRASLDKPVYKEKLRLRSYGVPESESQVFLEVKKKYQDVVYKRREALPLAEAERYLESGRSRSQSQILHEIDWMFRIYPDLEPRAFLSYERDAYCGDGGLRMTFDDRLLFRREDLDLRRGIYGQALLTEDLFVLEIKALGAMPLWLADALDRCQARPASFSKYGAAYCRYLARAWEPAGMRD